MQMHVSHVHVFSKYNFLQTVLIKSILLKRWIQTLVSHADRGKVYLFGINKLFVFCFV